jgi:hypothetical protein
MLLTSLIVSVHLLSLHDAPGFQAVTPGLSIREPETGLTVGILKNSEGGDSVFAGKLMEHKNYGLFIGAITGYKSASVLPMVVPSYKINLANDVNLRFSYLAKVNSNGANAIHFSIEKKF